VEHATIHLEILFDELCLLHKCIVIVCVWNLRVDNLKVNPQVRYKYSVKIFVKDKRGGKEAVVAKEKHLSQP
jgi:hypothetical protein